MAWAPDYVSLVEARSYATRSTETADDVELALAVTAASRAVDRHTNRQFGVVAVAEERLYRARWDRRRCRWLVEIDDLMDDTGADPTVVDEDGTVLGTIDSYTLEPRNAAARGRPWTLLVVRPDSATKPAWHEETRVAMTRLWGWTAVPDPVKQGTLLQMNRFVSRRTSPYGIAGSPDVGSELRLLARLDPDVAVTLGPYIRWWAAA